MLIPPPHPQSPKKYNEKEKKKLHFRMENNLSASSKLKKTQ